MQNHFFVTVYYKKKDRYGRVLGTVFVDKINVNNDMVKSGYAWHFKKYSDSKELAQLENEARRQKNGLWFDVIAQFLLGNGGK